MSTKINDKFGGRAQSLAAENQITTIAIIGRNSALVCLAVRHLGITEDLGRLEGTTTFIDTKFSGPGRMDQRVYLALAPGHTMPEDLPRLMETMKIMSHVICVVHRREDAEYLKRICQSLEGECQRLTGQSPKVALPKLVILKLGDAEISTEDLPRFEFDDVLPMFEARLIAGLQPGDGNRGMMEYLLGPAQSPAPRPRRRRR